MKKIIAILLSTAMLVAMLAVMAIPASAAGAPIAVNAFNPAEMASGVSAIFTQPYTAAGYEEHIAFAPVSGDTYEVVEMAGYDVVDGAEVLGRALDIPMDGFVWCIQWAAENANIDAACIIANAIKVGETYTIKGLDLANGTFSDVTIDGPATAGYSDAPASADKYDTTGNIALNKDVDGEGFGTYTADLTDGKAIDTLTWDSQWFAFCTEVINESGDSNGGNSPKGIGSVVVDLGDVYDLGAFKVNALYGQNIESSGINSPAKISVYVSETAKGDFTYVGDLTTSTKDGAAWATLEASAKGQFVKVEVTIDGLFAFINEIAVYEGEAASEEPSEAPSASEEPSEAPSASEEPSEAPSASEEPSEAPSASEEPSVEPETSEEVESSAPEADDTTDDQPTEDEPTEDAPSEDVSSEESSENVPSTGDSSSVIFFVIIAVVAIAGTAVVIKTRK